MAQEQDARQLPLTIHKKLKANLKKQARLRAAIEDAYYEEVELRAVLSRKVRSSLPSHFRGAHLSKVTLSVDGSISEISYSTKFQLSMYAPRYSVGFEKKDSSAATVVVSEYEGWGGYSKIALEQTEIDAFAPFIPLSECSRD